MTAIITTTAFVPSLTDPRFLQFIKTCEEAETVGIPIACVYAAPSKITPDVAEMLRDYGAIPILQDKPGMGASRRETLQYGLSTPAKVIIWIEPEKYPLVSLLEPVIAMVNGGYDLVVPRRESLDSYPAYQQYSEYSANWTLANITGRYDLDLMFGPRVLSRTAAELFSSYIGKTPEKDNWEVIFIPVLQAIHYGMKVGFCPVKYVHPPEQTKREELDAVIDRKRDQQRGTLIAAMQEEAARLSS